MLWGSAIKGTPAKSLDLPEGPVPPLGILKHAGSSFCRDTCLQTTFHRFESLEWPPSYHETWEFGARRMTQ